jgi:flagellar hook-associated protein 1 FlgK
MTGILGTALSGLMAFQRSLDTTSHNIANVNTDGYSRQRVELGTLPAEFTGAGYMGQGVNVTTISRSYDQFITNQLTFSTSAFAETNTFSTLASRVDNIIANEATGLSPALKSFFNAVNEVANDPSSLPVRQVMVSEAESLTQQFNTLSSQFEGLRNQTNNQMQATVDDINAFAESIATLNSKIVADSSRTSGGQLPNDSMDQRDALLAKIAEKVSVSTITQQNGSISVFIGKGQSLVLGASATQLSLAESSADPGHKEILMGGQEISKHITGGELSGALKFRDEVLDPARQQLGLVAAGFAVQFNKLHAAPGAAFDLNGNQGTDMFGFGAMSVVPAPGSTGSIAATYDPANAGNLNPSDYRLDYNGGTYSLTRLSDNTPVTLPGTFPVTPASVEGMTITQAALPTGASSFLIRPTFDAAKKMTALIIDPVKIAAAGTTGGPGSLIPGDNTVALSLANLDKQSVLLGGKVTLNGAYSQLVAKVGTLTHAAKINSSAQEVLFNQAKQARENLAGVNLDEEAANLIKFQQSYQAAAQAIAIASSLFDTLIGAVR